MPWETPGPREAGQLGALLLTWSAALSTHSLLAEGTRRPWRAGGGDGQAVYDHSPVCQAAGWRPGHSMRFQSRQTRGMQRGQEQPQHSGPRSAVVVVVVGRPCSRMMRNCKAVTAACETRQAPRGARTLIKQTGPERSSRGKPRFVFRAVGRGGQKVGSGVRQSWLASGLSISGPSHLAQLALPLTTTSAQHPMGHPEHPQPRAFPVTHSSLAAVQGPRMGTKVSGAARGSQASAALTPVGEPSRSARNTPRLLFTPEPCLAFSHEP